MSVAEIFIAALCFAIVVAFLIGEQYGRSRERRVRERMHDRYRQSVIEEANGRAQTLRELAWHGPEGSRS